MSDHLTRKEIKQQDQFQTSVVGAIGYVESHRSKLVMGLAAIAALLLVVLGTGYFLRAKEAKAQAQLAEAMRIADAPVGTPPQAGSDLPYFSDEAARQAKAKTLFEAVRADHGSSDAGAVAAVYLARFAQQEGQLDKARALFQEYLDDHSSGMLAASVRMSLFAMDRASGKGEAVVTELEKLLAAKDVDIPQDTLLFELATTLDQLGRADEAKTKYQKIVDEFPSSPYQDAARQKAGGGGLQSFPQAIG